MLKVYLVFAIVIIIAIFSVKLSRKKRRYRQKEKVVAKLVRDKVKLLIKRLESLIITIASFFRKERIKKLRIIVVILIILCIISWVRIALVDNRQRIDEVFFEKFGITPFCSKIPYNEEWKRCVLGSDCTLHDDYCCQPEGVNKKYLKIYKAWLERQMYSCACFTYTDKSVKCKNNKCVVKFKEAEW